MLDGQFYPGQPLQFESNGIIKPPWHRETLMNIITRQGLTSNLKLCLDSADGSSYTSGQSWADRSGNGYDFFLGADGSATATDPTFTGSADSRANSSYFALDGGDYFTYDGGANETWMNNLHKNNALFSVFMVVWLGSIGGTQMLFSTHNGSNQGVLCYISSSGNWLLESRASGTNQGSPSLNLNLSGDQSGKWLIMGLTVDEAAGNTYQYSIGDVEATNTGTFSYVTPSASDAVGPMLIGAQVGPSAYLRSGGRLACLAMWEGVGLTAAQHQSLYRALNSARSYI